MIRKFYFPQTILIILIGLFAQNAAGQATITSNPSAVLDTATICHDFDVIFTAQNEPLATSDRSWQVRVSGGNTWADITDEEQLTLTRTGDFSLNNGFSYRFRTSFIDLGGDLEDQFSNVITMVVDERPNPGITTVAQAVCSADFANLTGVLTPAKSTGIWSTTGIGILTPISATSTDITGMSKGPNAFIWTVENGVCTVDNIGNPFATSIVITSDQAPNSPISTGITDLNVCIYESFNFNATSPETSLNETAKWTAVSGGLTLDAAAPNGNTSPTAEAAFTTAGTKNFTWNIYSEYSRDKTGGLPNGCSAEQVTIAIGIYAEPVININPIANTIICAETKNIVGNVQNGSGTWESNNNTAIANPNNTVSTTFENLVQGENEFTFTATNTGCTLDASDDPYEELVTVTRDVPIDEVNEVGIISPATGTHYCEGANVDIEVKPTGVNIGAWTSGGTFTGSKPNFISPAIIVGDQTYTWSVTTPYGKCLNQPKTEQITLIGDAKPKDAIITFPINDGDEFCDNIVDVTAVNPTPSTGTWSVTPFDDGETFNNNPSFSTEAINLQQGKTYTLTYTTSNAGVCESVDAQRTFRYVNIDPATITGDDDVCEGANVLYNGRTKVVGESTAWYLYESDGTTLIEGPIAGDDYNLPTNLVANDYVLSCLISIDGLDCSASETKTITVNAPPTQPTGTDPAVFCLNDETTADIIVVNDGFAGSWTVDNGGAPLTATPNVTAQSTLDFTGKDESITYHYTWTPDEVVGCEGLQPTKTIAVTFDQILSPLNAGQPYDEFCETSGTLNASAFVGDDTGFWRKISGDGNVTTPTSPVSGVTGLTKANPLILNWVIVDGACADSVENVVISTIEPLTTADPGTYEAICADNLSILANLAGTDEVGKWILKNDLGTDITGVNIDNPNTNPANIINLSTPGDYDLGWIITSTLNTNCADTVETTIRRLEDFSNASLTRNNDTTICKSSTLVLDGNQPNTTELESGQWTLVNQPPGGNIPATLSNNYNFVATGFDAVGEYVLRWTVDRNTANCTERDSVDKTVHVAEASDVGIDLPADNFAICGDSLFLEGSNFINGFETVAWEIKDDSDAVIYTSSQQDTIINFLASEEGNFTITYTISSATCGINAFPISGTRYIQPVSDAGTTDITICESELPLTLDATAANAGTGTWTGDNGIGGTNFDDDNVATTNLTNLSPNTYLLTWEIDNGGCTASDTRTVTIEEGLTQALIQNTAADVCLSDATITIRANELKEPEISSFVVIAGNSLVSFNNQPNDSTIVYNLAAKGEVTIRFITGDGTIVDCPNADTTEYTFNIRPELSDPSATDPAAICNADGNNTVMLSANLATDVFGVEGVGGYWTPIGLSPLGIDTLNINYYLSGLTQGTHTYQWTSTNGGCPDKTTSIITVQVDSTNGVTNTGNDSILCTQPFDMFAIDPIPGVGTWSVASGDVGTIAGSELNNIDAEISGLTVNTPTHFVWTVIEGSCTRDDTVAITLRDVITLPAITDDTLISCTGAADSITAAIDIDAVNGEAGIWKVIPASVEISFNNATNFNTTVSASDTGSHYLYWIVENECDSVADSLFYAYYATPEVDANDTDSICATSYSLNGTLLDLANGETGEWTILYNGGSGDVDSTNSIFINKTKNDFDATIRTLGDGVYTCQWNVSNDCNNAVQIFSINKFGDLTPAEAGPDQNICIDTTNMTFVSVPVVSNTEIGTWLFVSGSGNIFVGDENTPNAKVENLALGESVYKWTISNGVCPDLDDLVTIYVGTPVAGIINAGDDIFTCIDNITLNGSNPDGTNREKGIWTVDTEPALGAAMFVDSSLFNTQAMVFVGGDYKLVWNIFSACDTIRDTVEVLRFNDDINTTNPANAGVDNTVCGSTANLNADAATQGIGVWKKVSGTGNIRVGDENLPNPVAEGLVNGDPLELSWVLRDGTCAEDSSNSITIEKTGTLTTPAVADNQDICEDNTFLEVTNDPLNPGETGQWVVTIQPGGSGVPTFSPNTLDFNPKVSALEYGVYEFGWIVGNGVCDDDTAFVQVTYYETPASSDAGNDVTTCDTDAAPQLGAVDANLFTGTWTSPNGALIFTDDQPGLTVNTNNQNAYVQGAVAGVDTLIWTVSNGVCTAESDTTLLYINELPADEAGGSDNMCDDSYDLNGKSPLADNSETGEWVINYDSGSGDVNITANPATFITLTKNDYNPTINTTNTGVYTCVWTVTNACGSDTQTFTITKYEALTILSAGADKNICANSTSMTATPATNPGEQGTWSKVGAGNGDIAPADINNPTALVSDLVQGIGVTFRWTINNTNAPSCGTVSDDVDIYFANPVAGTVSAGDDQHICQDTTYLDGTTPNASNSENGIWTVISEPSVGAIKFIDDASKNTAVACQIGGEYILQWSVQGACDTIRDEVTIQRYDNINATNPSDAGSPVIVCTTSYTLQGNTPSQGNGVWEWLSGPGNIKAGEANLPNATLEGLNETQATTVRWILRPGTCAADSSEVTISKSGSLTDPTTGGNQEICTNFAVLEVTNPVLKPGETGEWTVTQKPAGAATPGFTPDEFSYDPTVSGLEYGVYEFTWTIGNGVCADATTSTQVSYYETPENAKADDFGRDTLFACEDYTSITLNATAAIIGQGQWSSPNGVAFDDVNSPISAINSPFVVRIDTLVWTLTNDVCSSQPDTVIVRTLPVITDVTLGLDMQICVDTVELNGTVISANETGTWSVNTTNNVTGFSYDPNENDASAVARGLLYGQYEFTWTIDNGGYCTAKSDEIVVDYFETPAIGNAGIDIDLCVGDANPQLIGADPSPYEGTWTSASGSIGFTSDIGGTTPDENNPNAYVQSWSIGIDTLIWTVNNQVCPATGDSLILTVSDTPTAANADEGGTTDTEICASDELQLDANTPALNKGTGLWTSDDAANTNFADDTDPNTTVTFNTDKVYRLTWTISNGACTPSSDFIDITVNPIPVTPFAGVNDTICVDSYIGILNASDPGAFPAKWVQATEDLDVVTITSPNTRATDLTDIGVGNHHLIWEVTTVTCGVLRDTVNIRRSAEPIVNAGIDQDLCYDETNFAATDPGVGEGVWTKDDGLSNGTIATPASPTSFLSNLDLGITVFNWTVTNEACGPYVQQVSMNVNPYPEPDAMVGPADNEVELCETTVLQLDAVIPDPNFSAKWRVISPLANTITFDDDSKYDAIASGLDYGLTLLGWSLNNGQCEVEDTVWVTNYRNPTPADINVNNLTTCDTTYQFNADFVVYGQGMWQKLSGPAGGNIDDVTSASAKVNPLQPGVYEYRWTTTNGVCPSSSDTVDVEVLDIPISNAGIDTSLCNTVTTSITLYANTVAAGQLGTWTKSIGSGTLGATDDPNTTVTNLSVGANEFVWTVDNGTCFTKDTIVITLYEAPSAATVGADGSTCGTTYSLSAGNVSVGTGMWSLISGQGTIVNPLSKTTLVNNLGVGANQFEWTVSNGACASSKAVQTITRKPLPEQADAGTNQLICADSIVLSANTSAVGTGTWSAFTGTGTFGNVNDPLAKVRGLSEGLNRLVWKISTPTCGFTTDTVNISVQPKANPVNAGDDETTCNANVFLNATAPVIGTGYWTTTSIANIINLNDRNTAITNLDFGDNTFTWVVVNEPCQDSTDEVIITRLVPPIDANSGTDQWLCVDNTQLDANNDPNATGTWTLVPGQGTGAFTNANLYNTTVTGLGYGVNKLVWTLSKGVCNPKRDTVYVTVQEPTSTVFAGNDQTICVDTVILNATVLTQGIGHWETAGGEAFDNIFDRNTKVTNLSIGDNTFTWVVENGPCVDETDEVVITRLAKPIVANAGNDQWICDDNTQLAGNDDPTAIGQWTLVPGFAAGTFTNASLYNTTITGLTDGTHRLAWTLTKGVCPASSDTVEIKVQPRTLTVFAGNDQTVCVDTVILNATALTQGIGHWETTGGEAFDNIFDRDTKVTNLSIGDNTLTWVVENGPCVDETDEVVITRLAKPIVANAGNDQWICDDNTQL
ncbi:MAG: hypothetical protein ACJAUV_000371, partial [Flavobacteriales bacterium]